MGDFVVACVCTVYGMPGDACDVFGINKYLPDVDDCLVF